MFGQFTPYLTVFIYLGILENITQKANICSFVSCLQYLPTRATARLRATLSLYPSLLKSFKRIPILFFHSHTRHRLPAIGQTKDNMRDTNALEKDITTPLHSIKVNNK